MDTPFQVEVLRLHCEHLRTLLDRVILEFTTMEHELATDRNPSFATIAPQTLSGSADGLCPIRTSM